MFVLEHSETRCQQCQHDYHQLSAAIKHFNLQEKCPQFHFIWDSFTSSSFYSFNFGSFKKITIKQKVKWIIGIQPWKYFIMRSCSEYRGTKFVQKKNEWKWFLINSMEFNFYTLEFVHLSIRSSVCPSH